MSCNDSTKRRRAPVPEMGVTVRARLRSMTELSLYDLESVAARRSLWSLSPVHA